MRPACYLQQISPDKRLETPDLNDSDMDIGGLGGIRTLPLMEISPVSFPFFSVRAQFKYNLNLDILMLKCARGCEMSLGKGRIV